MRIDRLRVEVADLVEPTALAAAIRLRLAGADWPAGPERQVADAVVVARDGTHRRPADAAVGPAGRAEEAAARWS